MGVERPDLMISLAEMFQEFLAFKNHNSALILEILKPSKLFVVTFKISQLQSYIYYKNISMIKFTDSLLVLNKFKILQIKFSNFFFYYGEGIEKQSR